MDTRDSDFGAAEHWSGEALGQRASFRSDRHPAALVIANVRPKDEGLYRCRVDFRLAQTRNAHVNLSVVGKCRQVSASVGGTPRSIVDGDSLGNRPLVISRVEPSRSEINLTWIGRARPRSF